MPFYRYLEHLDVHVIDCAGYVDLQLGLERFGLLQRELASRPPVGEQRKLLIDFRRTVWASPEVHMQLSRITRRDFGLDPQSSALRVAILDAVRGGPVSSNERWFFDEGDALAWLAVPAERI